MATSKLSTLYAVDIASTLLDEISNVNVDPAIQKQMAALGGAIEPRFVTIMGQSPVINFSSHALARCLAAVGVSGLALASPAELFWQAILIDGGREGTLKHFQMTVNAGLVVPRRISAQQGGLATITYDIICRYNGTNEPIVYTVDQTLAGSPTVDELFTIGKATINGVDLTGITGIDIDFGLQIVQQISDGDIWPTFVGIMERSAPVISIITTDVVSMNTFGLDGTAQGATDSLVYFRKKLADGGNVTDVTAEHIKFSIDAGIITVEQTGGGHPGPIECTVMITPVFDGTAAILAISTASAIA